MNGYEKTYDAVVVGAGHAGAEAALALARTGCKTLLTTLSLDAIAFMACNPAIGGTAKGHLVREIDALGGEMGLAADANLLQLRMLNTGKGAAVRSLRGQADKQTYHTYVKSVLERTENLTILQAEIARICVENGRVTGVITTLGQRFSCRAVVVASGVYLNAQIIVGDFRQSVGPNNFAAATALTGCLIDLGLNVRRFKTGTPARIHRASVDFSVMEIQNGEENLYPFSFMTDGFIANRFPCYLTYTTQKTKEIILANLDRSPLFNGSIKSVGPRYCPSIEDKIVRFSDKERHQIFIEPESASTEELYVQGMSSSMPYDVQLAMYRSVTGLERCRIMRYAYAIEYDCIDSTALDATLRVKGIDGLYTAGQINGSSGYEEAAAQGLIAGLNASLALRGKEPLILDRASSYIGVLIDDLVTKGTNEPYRMMTARAEHRLHLRQENADARLTPLGRAAGLVDDERYRRFAEKQEQAERCGVFLSDRPSFEKTVDFLRSVGESAPDNALSYREMLKRTAVTAENIAAFFPALAAFDPRVLAEWATQIKYEGYLRKQSELIADNRRLEARVLPADIDYLSLAGLRLEARQKLNKIRPANLGQASRISGVSPADITVLMVYLGKK